MNPNTGTQEIRKRVVFGSTGNILEIDIAIVSVRVSIAVIKYCDPKQFREEKVHATVYSPSSKKVVAGI